MSGEWVFIGTRVPLTALFENLKDGASVDQFLEWFPGVRREQVMAVLNRAMTFNIYELLDRIRPRPAMYLGKPSVSVLRAFLDGYIFALSDSGIEISGEPPFYAFHDWVALKLGHYEGTSGWNNMLLESENGDEEKALSKFFVYLDEFKERRAEIILQAVPDATKAWRYTVDPDTKEQTALELPALVQIVKYTNDKGVFIRYVNKNGDLVDREKYCQDLDVAFVRTESLVEKNAWARP